MRHGARRGGWGFTLIEALGALALVAVLSAGAVAMIHASLEDTRAQHAGRHQATVVEATHRYVREHYTDLMAASASGPTAVPLSTITGFLPVGFQATNAYGQTPCVRVMQPAPGRLHVLIVAEGGESIPRKDLTYVAAHAGPGGGLVAQEDPAFAQGSFGSWRVDVASFGGSPCGSVAAGTPPNRLASALFFNGPDTSESYLYCGEVVDHPELNAMSMPIAMRGRAVAVENDTSDPLCSTADALAQGRITVSAEGILLTCQSGRWRRQASAFWKDPVADFASLPTSGNDIGDTRVTIDTRRAFTWGGSDWKALAVDQNGDMEVPRQLTLVNTVVRGSACSPDGAVSRDAGGRPLSCQSGTWRTVGSKDVDPSQSQRGDLVIVRSNYITYAPGTQFYTAPFAYDAAEDTMNATITRSLRPVRDALIISNVSLDMSVGHVNYTFRGRFTLDVRVIDLDTGAVIAVNREMSPEMVNDRTIGAVTLSKAVPRNVNGYAFEMTVRWTRFRGSYADNFYDQANYLNAAGEVVEITPIQLTWSIDLTY